MKLYEINEELLRLDSTLSSIMINDDETSSELTGLRAEIKDAFESLGLERNTKIEHIGLLIKQADKLSGLIKDEIQNLQHRRSIHEKKIDWLKNYLTFCMQEGEKFETGKVKIGWKKSETFETDNEDLIPREFMRQKIIYEPDKMRIKELIKSGTPVPYCRVVEKKNIQIK